LGKDAYMKRFIFIYYSHISSSSCPYSPPSVLVAIYRRNIIIVHHQLRFGWW
jgi:hypothetical protein